MFAKAIELDNDFATPYGAAAFCYVIRKINGWTADRAQEMAETARLARLAAQLGKDDAVALSFARWGMLPATLREPSRLLIGRSR